MIRNTNTPATPFQNNTQGVPEGCPVTQGAEFLIKNSSATEGHM